MVQFNALQSFVPSGKDFNKSKELFLEIGFSIVWEADDYVHFKKDNARFILQRYDDKVNDLDEFWAEINQKELDKKYPIKLIKPTEFPWGREVNLIDIAGVCWHISGN
jgi:hypothetical protein